MNWLAGLSLGGAWLHVHVAVAAGAVAAGPRAFEFREPHLRQYRVAPESQSATARGVRARAGWVRLERAEGAGPAVEAGRRIVLGLRDGAAFEAVIAGHSLALSETVSSGLYVLEAPDAGRALEVCDALARDPRVSVSVPVLRRPKVLHGAYAPRPNDPYFDRQWYLENLTGGAVRLGIDLNARAAWAVSRGEGVTVAVSDDGIEFTHADLKAQVPGTNHYNFLLGTTNGMPTSNNQIHGTAVAGLVAATGNNGVGLSGTAPAARLASWIIFGGGNEFPGEDDLRRMFQYRSDAVWVQNHSWGNTGPEQVAVGALEQAGIAAAIHQGRGGLGVAMVRSVGNSREELVDANDDGYAQDPRVIAVAAVRSSGRVTSYSTPGAPILVAAPSGDLAVEVAVGVATNYPTLFTTDRTGVLGWNNSSVPEDLPDYVHGETGFSGTSAAAPQVAGLVAMILSVNPALGYRDVQQILIFAARHVDLEDPDARLNGAGFRVSHNLGFGIPDAGHAVWLAARWPRRPNWTTVSVTDDTSRVIADDGLRVRIAGPNVPLAVQSIPAWPSFGVHVAEATATLPLAYVGLAKAPIPEDLTGRAALIDRGENFFEEKIRHAAAAGASFAILANNRDTNQRFLMGGTDFAAIPAVGIDQQSGAAVREYLAANPAARAQLTLDRTVYALAVTNTLLLEHVAVTVRTTHSRRADVRLTLISPAGTRSVLQRLSEDTNSRMREWTYYSVHHFYESSAGTWQVEFSDERAGLFGVVEEVSLTLFGVPIEDADRDGLDDAWERQWFGDLSARPDEDPEGDGFSNVREYVLGFDPRVSDVAFRVDLARWDTSLARLSWPAAPQFDYEVRSGTEVGQPWPVVTNLSGRFPEVEWFTPSTNLAQRFFHVRAVPKP